MKVNPEKELHEAVVEIVEWLEPATLNQVMIILKCTYGVGNRVRPFVEDIMCQRTTPVSQGRFKVSR